MPSRRLDDNINSNKKIFGHLFFFCIFGPMVKYFRSHGFYLFAHSVSVFRPRVLLIVEKSDELETSGLPKNDPRTVRI